MPHSRSVKPSPAFKWGRTILLACFVCWPAFGPAWAQRPAQPTVPAPAGIAPQVIPPQVIPPQVIPPRDLGAGPRALDLQPDSDLVQGVTDPVIGSVDGNLIYLSDLGRASATLPENLRGLPFDSLYPVLLDRMIDHAALVMMARRRGLEENPAVRREIKAATERILESAWLGIDAQPKITEQALQARYNRQFANRPATEEVRARHILVTTEAEAMKIIEDLRKGADFATIARLVSKDPDGQKGGELGFFRREQVWPSFADLAFNLQPGQIGGKAIRNEFGWHVVKVDERRLVAPPGYSEIRETLRQELVALAVQESVDNARGQMVIRRFNMDGSDLETLSKAPKAAPASR